MNRSLLLGWAALALAIGCGNNNASTAGAASGSPAMSGAPAMSGSAMASGAPAASGAAAAGPGCASVGCGTAQGDFFNKCDCKGKGMTPPLVAKWTGKVDSFFKSPTFEVENTSDKDIHWASAAAYYYDKAGKQIEVETKDKKSKYKSYTVNGSNFSLKPKEKKEISIGWKEDLHPKDTAKIEVVFDGWCYGKYDDKPNELCINVDRAPEERPPSK